MHRSYVSLPAAAISAVSDAEIYGLLALKLPFAVEPPQRLAWEFQIRHLRELSDQLPNAHFLMEFLIPRMGRRADLVILDRGIIFVLEYKIGARHFDRSSLDQVYGYGLDLKNFHETSHGRRVVPILVATAADAPCEQVLTWAEDGLADPICATPDQVAQDINRACRMSNEGIIDADQWQLGRYRPTPTIVEAAQALFRGHAVEEISRSEAGAENLTQTASYVTSVIESAKANSQKVICFVTGVPGSGKTLAGLNIATARQRKHADEHAVFLSGNGPLVAVLREALTLDAVARARDHGTVTSRAQEGRRASAFVQNIHHFRDEALTSDQPPDERVAVFDEAQRAWDHGQTSKFMQQKKGQFDFSMSEPEFLLSVMDRHEGWCAIICLIGGGQEINTGEAGVEEWLRAIERSYPHWHVHMPSTLANNASLPCLIESSSLHLATSIRSFRAERLSDFVGHLIDGNVTAASETRSQIENFPLVVTRNLGSARSWLRERRRGNERAGLLASSNAARLKPDGIFVKAKIEPEKWFLANRFDVRSSDVLEDVATEFDIQGLELDWTCVCWDANFRRQGGKWGHFQFKGSAWQTINDERRKAYLQNSYRVLLTRARQGMIVFVPLGSDTDPTREPTWYDGIASYLIECGFQLL